MASNACDFKLDAKDSPVESEKQKAVEEKNPSSEEAKLPQATLDSRRSSRNKDRNFDTVISYDFEPLLFDRNLN